MVGCQEKFVSDIAIFVLKRDVKLQLTNCQEKCKILEIVITMVFDYFHGYLSMPLVAVICFRFRLILVQNYK